MTATYPSTDDRRPGLKPPQFGLRMMFIVVSALCCLMVTVRAAGPLVGSALLLLLMAIFAHVAGNVLGCRLRANGDMLTSESGPGAPRPCRRRTPPNPIDFAPLTQLGMRRAVGPSMRVLTVLGAITGAVGGGWFLVTVNWERATLVNISIGTVSFAVLGGLWGFGASSFLRVFCGALAQAHRESEH